MIKVIVNTENDDMHVTCECSYKGKRRGAIAEFKAVLDALNRADGDTFTYAMGEFLEEEFCKCCEDCEDDDNE